MNADDIVIRQMVLADEERVRNIQYYYLLGDDAITNIMTEPLDIPREVKALVDPTVSRAIHDGMSLVAEDIHTGKVVGIRSTFLMTPSTPFELPVEAVDPDNDDTSKLRLFLPLKEQLYSCCDFFTEYSVSEFAAYHGLAVIPEYRRRGIASRLMNESSKIIIARGIRLITASCTSNHARKLFNKLGFQTLNSVTYADYEINGERPFSGPSENKMLSLHAKLV